MLARLLKMRVYSIRPSRREYNDSLHLVRNAVLQVSLGSSPLGIPERVCYPALTCAL